MLKRVVSNNSRQVVMAQDTLRVGLNSGDDCLP